jgi:hypothetical protein
VIIRANIYFRPKAMAVLSDGFGQWPRNRRFRNGGFDSWFQLAIWLIAEAKHSPESIIDIAADAFLDKFGKFYF